MTTTMYQPNPFLFGFNENSIIYNNQGVDSISFMGRYEMTLKLFRKMGLKELKSYKHTPVSEAIKRLIDRELENKTRRYKKDGANATFKVFKSAKGRSLSSYIVIESYTAKTMDYATLHKKPKGTYGLVHFMGLHQPTKKLHCENMAIVSDFLKRKRFKISNFDLATDVKDHKEVNHKRKESFKNRLFPVSKNGVISKGSSLYINEPIGVRGVSRLLYYDKFLKQTKVQKQSLSLELREWKRLEITISFNLTKKANRMSGKEYFTSNRFINDLTEVSELIELVNSRGFKNHYLEYQISSFIDKRVMNNQESRKHFNSIKALERFERSDFRPFGLGLLI